MCFYKTETYFFQHSTIANDIVICGFFLTSIVMRWKQILTPFFTVQVIGVMSYGKKIA